MKVILWFTIVIALTTLQARTTFHARSKNVCPNFKPISKEQRAEFTELVKSHKIYKFLEKTPHESIKINVPNPSCEINNSDVIFTAKPIKVDNIDCRIKEFTLRYQIKNKRVDFNEKWNYKILNPTSLKSLIEKAIKGKLSRGFFKESNYCYAELMDNNDWWIHLRNNKKQFCYLKVTQNGEKVEIIKRLYAKNSQCF